MKKIVIDVCGSDYGPEVILRGVKESLDIIEDYGLVLVGDEGVIKDVLGADVIAERAIEILHATDVITNHDAPTAVFKGREQASMVMALDRLKSDPDCAGMLSAGNTGALMVGSIFRLGLAKGLRQPALASDLPCWCDKHMALVDCGAGVDCKPDDLAGFALMGDTYIRAMYGISSPKIGLLSVGREKGKGNTLTKDAFALLENLPISFIGNIEGCDIFSGEADVVVCDGFAGNVVLKNTEAAGHYAMSLLDVDGVSVETKEVLAKIKRQLFATFAYNAQGGAIFLGTRKTIIKMHGCATENTVKSCIGQMIRLENNNFAASTVKAIEGWKAAKND